MVEVINREKNDTMERDGLRRKNDKFRILHSNVSPQGTQNLVDTKIKKKSTYLIQTNIYSINIKINIQKKIIKIKQKL